MQLIFDGHLDLALFALAYNRDQTATVAEINAAEKGATAISPSANRHWLRASHPTVSRPVVSISISPPPKWPTPVPKANYPTITRSNSVVKSVSCDRLRNWKTIGNNGNTIRPTHSRSGLSFRWNAPIPSWGPGRQNPGGKPDYAASCWRISDTVVTLPEPGSLAA